MTFHNDNDPPALETSRVLPILGRVDADGRIQGVRPPSSEGPQDWSPNDPREA